MQIKEIMSEKVKYLTIPGNRLNALRFMREKNVSCVPVIKEDTNEVVGIVTRSDLITNPDEDQLALVMTRNPICAKSEDTVSNIAKIFHEHKFRRAPVVEDGKLVGMLTASDLVAKAISQLDIQNPIEPYMISYVPTAWDRTPLSLSFQIMLYFKLKVLLTLNAESKLSGILTETDFFNESEIVSEKTVHNTSVGTEGDKWSWDSENVLYVFKNHLKFSDKEAKEVANSNVVTCTSRTSVSECALKMKENKIEQLPVLNVEGELIALLRASDLIKSLID